MTLDGQSHPLGAVQAIDVAHRAAHRISNTGSDLLVFIEIQHGDYGEDDIERLDDDVGRLG